MKRYGKLFNLKGKAAIVTGGAGLLGRRFCEGLAEFGARVAVVDIAGAGAQRLAKELRRRYGIRAVGIECDVSSPEAVKEMVRKSIHSLGPVNILLNNAAHKSSDLSAFYASFEDYSPREWRKIMEVNLDGMFLVAQAVGKQMIRQGKGGSIIQTASIYGILGPDHRIYEGAGYAGGSINSPAVYAASKGGVVALTRYLAAYWARQGIRVNTITPGGVEGGQNEKFKKKYSHRVPLGRMARADELVGALIYLASDASSYVTGQNLIVDGGLSAW